MQKLREHSHCYAQRGKKNLSLSPMHLPRKQGGSWLFEKAKVLAQHFWLQLNWGVTESIKYKHGLSDFLKVNQGGHVRLMNQTWIAQGSYFSTSAQLSILSIRPFSFPVWAVSYRFSEQFQTSCQKVVEGRIGKRSWWKNDTSNINITGALDFIISLYDPTLGFLIFPNEVGLCLLPDVSTFYSLALSLTCLLNTVHVTYIKLPSIAQHKVHEFARQVLPGWNQCHVV